MRRRSCARRGQPSCVTFANLWYNCRMDCNNGKFDYEKRIADYRASTDRNALGWRTAVLGMDEKAQKRAYFRFAVADGRMAEAVHSIVGIDVDGWPIMMQGNHVVHIEKRHGVNGAQDKSMSDPEDFARIAFALRNFDAIARLPDNPSYRTKSNVAAAQLEFRTRIDGTSVISTVVPDTSRQWMLITSARIEKRKADEHL